jgi:hypothetical protein
MGKEVEMGIFRHTEHAVEMRERTWDRPGMAPELNHQSWQNKGDGVYCRCAPASKPPREYHVSTPHPTRAGFRVFWLFLPVGAFACVLISLAWECWPIVSGWFAVMALGLGGGVA